MDTKQIKRDAVLCVCGRAATRGSDGKYHGCAGLGGKRGSLPHASGDEQLAVSA